MKKKKRTVEALKWSFTTAVANNHCRFSPFLSFFFQKTSTSQKKKKRKAHERMHLFELMVSDTELHTVSLYIFHKTQKCRSASTLYFGLGLVKKQQKNTHTHKKKKKTMGLIAFFPFAAVGIYHYGFFFFCSLSHNNKKKRKENNSKQWQTQQERHLGFPHVCASYISGNKGLRLRKHASKTRLRIMHLASFASA